MRNYVSVAAVAVVAFSLGWASKPDARSELLAVHERELEAHRRADVEMLGQSADGFITVSDGQIRRVTPEQERKFFTGYFQGAKYPEYVNVDVPVVGVSQDGTLGYVISRIRAHRQQAGPNGQLREGRFVYAGIMVYEKRDGKYVRVANVSTFEPQESSKPAAN